MPVFPDVGSRIVWPAPIAPFSSASSIRARATLSLTDPVGLRDSSFAQMRTPGFGERLGNSTSGVLPIDCTMSPYRPPQGLLLTRSAGITSRNIAGYSSAILRSLRSMGPMERGFDFDWLVVGSGFGGSVSALRLSEKGYSVGVLECGRRFADNEFPRATADLKRYFWRPKL